MHSSSAYRGECASILAGYAISRAQVATDYAYCAKHKNQITGFYILIMDSEPELDRMFVADESRGLGVGKLLFENMLQLARKLDVHSIRIVSHLPARGFYLRMSAQEIGGQPPSGRITWSRPILRSIVPESS